MDDLKKRGLRIGRRKRQKKTSMGFQPGAKGRFFNPKGIASFSPALARFKEGLRRVANNQCHNTESVAYHLCEGSL